MLLEGHRAAAFQGVTKGSILLWRRARGGRPVGRNTVPSSRSAGTSLPQPFAISICALCSYNLSMKFGNMNSGGDFITGLDIGTSSIKVAVAERRANRPALLHVFKEQCFGMRKGAISEISEVSQAINRAL